MRSLQEILMDFVSFWINTAKHFFFNQHSAEPGFSLNLHFLLPIKDDWGALSHTLGPFPQYAHNSVILWDGERDLQGEIFLYNVKYKMHCHRSTKHTVFSRSHTDFSSGENTGGYGVSVPPTCGRAQYSHLPQHRQRNELEAWFPTCTHVTLRSGDLRTGKNRFLLALTLAGRKPLPGAVIPGKGAKQ